MSGSVQSTIEQTQTPPSQEVRGVRIRGVRICSVDNCQLALFNVLRRSLPPAPALRGRRGAAGRSTLRGHACRGPGTGPGDPGAGPGTQGTGPGDQEPVPGSYGARLAPVPGTPGPVPGFPGTAPGTPGPVPGASYATPTAIKNACVLRTPAPHPDGSGMPPPQLPAARGAPRGGIPEPPGWTKYKMQSKLPPPYARIRRPPLGVNGV